MELWLIYAILASVLIGLNNFFLKIFAEKRLDGTAIAIVQWCVFFLWGALTTSYLGIWSDIWNNSTIIAAFLMSSAYFFTLRARILSLEYITSSEYFIGYRVLLTLFLIIVWLVLFSEKIEVSQFFGIFLGTLALFFLFEKQETRRELKVWKRGVGYLFVTVCWATIVQTVSKYFVIQDFPITVLFLWQGIFYIFAALLLDRKKLFSENFRYSFSHSLGLMIVTCVFSLIGTTYNMLAYDEGGNLGIVMKIIAYSLFIPIILSMVFYHEKMSYKKWIAFVLTIISIYYLN